MSVVDQKYRTPLFGEAPGVMTALCAGRGRLRLYVFVALLSCSSAALACSVNASAVSFAQFNPLADSTNYGSGVIDISCPSSTSYTVSLSAGQGSFSSRYMTSGENQLLYNLYTGPSYDHIWGDGSGVTVQVSGSADTSGTSHTVYGRVPPQSSATVGHYSDGIVVTVSY